MEFRLQAERLGNKVSRLKAELHACFHAYFEILLWHEYSTA